MPASAPKLPVAFTSSVDEKGWPLCVHCDKRLRTQFGGYGYNGSGHFCSKTCAAEWADIKVQGIC